MNHGDREELLHNKAAALFEEAWADPSFFKHSPCRHCGSDEVEAAKDEGAPPDAELVQWICRSCGGFIP